MKIPQLLTAALFSVVAYTSAHAADAKKPNILVIFPDDVGWQNISAYGHGTMGYRTPNIDRIAREGVMFTDHYAQPSCTAGRAAFITGQYPKMRTERKQYIDGVNNLDYWLGKTEESARDSFIYYHESTVRAIRYRQWKLNFETSENYYDTYVKQKFPVIFNLRMDPFESFDGLTDRSDIVQAKQWLNEPVQEILGEHIKSLMDFPPAQKAATFDFSELMKSLMSGKQ